MKHRFFLIKGNIQSIKIISFLDKKRRIAETHGIIKVSDASAKHVVARLKSRKRGVEQKIDEYVIRMSSNDRRVNVAESSAYPNDRRKADRRRKGFTLITVCEKPRLDASGVITVLKRCEEFCSECGWKAVQHESAKHRSAEEVWD